MSDFRTVAKLGDLLEDVPMEAEGPDGAVVLIRRGDEVFALDDCCSHEEYPLSEGEVENGNIMCVLHGATFDIKTGRATGLPAVMGVTTYAVRIEGEDVQLDFS